MNTNNGKLHLILGSMYSGKSSILIKELLRYRAIGKKVFCISSSKDTRTPDEAVMTHDGITIPACKSTALMDNKVLPYNVEVVGIDEAQFFPDLIVFTKKLLSMGLHVIVAGLDGDYQQQSFGDILKLIPLADSYQKIYAFCKVCQDGTPGSFTKRIINNDNQVLVGADKEYIAVCRRHL